MSSLLLPIQYRPCFLPPPTLMMTSPSRCWMLKSYSGPLTLGKGKVCRGLWIWRSAKFRFAECPGFSTRQSICFFCLPFFSKTSSTKFFQIYFANALSNSLKNSYLMLLRKNPLFHAIIAQIQFVSTNYSYPVRVLLNLFECTLKIPCQIHSIVHI